MKLNRLGLAAVVLGALLAGCSDDAAQPFEVEGEGSLEGRLFFDANRNGAFDPLAGDEALAGVSVAVRERGTTQTFASGVTDAEGRFRFAGLPPGTHDIFIDPATVPEGAVICTNPLNATVYVGESQFATVGARGGCVVAIKTAEAMAPGTPVTVTGLVTSFPGQIRGGYTYLEDETGGVRLFGSAPEGQGIEIGDRIEISGTLGIFNNDLQISNVTVNEIQKAAGTPIPTRVSTGDVAAAGADAKNELQGKLVTIAGAEVIADFGESGLHAQNARIDSGNGAIELRIESGVASRTELGAIFDRGKCYDIMGVVGNFRGTAQVFPRSLSDIKEVPCS